MRPTNLKVLSFNFNLILLSLFLTLPSSAVSENFIKINNIFLFCPDCVIETAEPCSVRIGSSTTAVLCEETLPQLLQHTVNKAESGALGENIADYPGSTELLLQAYFDPDNLLLRDNLLRLLLLSSTGLTTIRENLSIILSRSLKSVPVMPTELEQESELFLVTAALGSPTSEQLANLQIFLSNGVSSSISDLFVLSEDHQKLSRLFFPFDGKLSSDLGTLGEFLFECKAKALPDSCLRGMEFVKSKFVDNKLILDREFFIASIASFNTASTETKLRIIRESSNLPLGFFTPDVLDGFMSLIAASGKDPVFHNEICSNPAAIQIPLSLDSRIPPLINSICKRQSFSYFSIFLISLSFLALLLILIRLRDRYDSHSLLETDKNSGQLTKLSESYRGEREELAKFFGISEHATANELNTSFKRLAKSSHPDSPTGSERAYYDLTTKFQRAKEIVVTNY